MRRLMLGLAAAAALAAGAARVEEAPEKLIIEGTADGKVRVITPGGRVMECTGLTMPELFAGMEDGRMPVTFEPAAGGRVTMRRGSVRNTATRFGVYTKAYCGDGAMPEDRAAPPAS